MSPGVHGAVVGGADAVELTGGCGEYTAARFFRPSFVRRGVVCVCFIVCISVFCVCVVTGGWHGDCDVVDASWRGLLAHGSRAQLEVDAASPRVQVARGRRVCVRRGLI